MVDGLQAYFNPYDPEFRANPYPYYRQLVGRPPVRIRGPGTSIVLVARYADACRVLHDPQTFSSQPPEHAPLRRLNLTGGAQTLLTSDPPAHSRLRKLVSRDFTPRRIAALEPCIRAISESLLDEVATRDGFDVMADLANRLPILVTAEMLGVPTDRYQQFKHWADTIVASAAAAPIPARPPEAVAAVAELQAFCVQEIDRRRRHPGPDLVSALVASQEAEALSEQELVGFLLLLLLAGAANTTNLIGNGLLALCRHPDQLARLRREPDLISSTVEEILRYDAPLQGVTRLTTRPVDIAGVRLEANHTVVVLIAAANRDPARFIDPESFNIGRTPNEHLAFGGGIHFCLGAPLAKLQGAIAISSVLNRFPRLRVADPGRPVRYKGSIFLRGLESLPMVI